MKKSWSNIIDNFKNSTILVIGDIMVDMFIWGKVSRISQEAPVPIVDVIKMDYRLGGAGNVLNNIVSLGGRALLCGVIGADRDGVFIKSKLEDMSLSTEGLVIDNVRPTTLKTRVIAKRQQLVRYDIETKDKIVKDNINKIEKFLSNKGSNVSLVIVSDYGKGVITENTMDILRTFSLKHGFQIIVDPNVENSLLYKGVYLVTPNHYEANKMANNGNDIDIVGCKILKELDSESVLVTRGKRGMSLFERNGRITHIKSVAKNVFDVVGAGDTVIATLGLCLSSGMDILDSVYLSNIAAGVVVGEVGTTTINIKKLKEEVVKRDEELTE